MILFDHRSKVSASKIEEKAAKVSEILSVKVGETVIMSIQHSRGVAILAVIPSILIEARLLEALRLLQPTKPYHPQTNNGPSPSTKQTGLYHHHKTEHAILAKRTWRCHSPELLDDLDIIEVDVGGGHGIDDPQHSVDSNRCQHAGILGHNLQGKHHMQHTK